MNTNRRRLMLSGAVLISLIAVVLGVLAMIPPGPGVTKAHFDRIEAGMTRAEIDAILGDENGTEFSR